MPGPRLVIGADRPAGDAGAYPIHNPARPDEVVFEAPAASSQQVDAAVAAARDAAAEWAGMLFDERADLVVRAGTAAAEAAAASDLARFLTREHGKVLWEAEFDVSTPAAIAQAFVDVARGALASTRTGEGPGSSEVEYVPFGVVAGLLPFNWPVSVLAMKAIPALLAGNTLVAKAPPTCPGAALEAAAAMAEVLPAGVINALSGPGPELGEALVTHEGVDMVSFTGGISTGRRVMAAAATKLHPVLLELGGNDAAIVAPDVEFEPAVVDRIFDGAFLTSGQVCMAIKRLYVPAERYADAVDALIERTSQVVVGDGLADGVTMGPVHTARSRDFVEGLLDEAEDAGAKVHRPATVRAEDADAGGFLVSPAIVERAPPETGIVREEQFAPALPVMPYRDLDDAVEQANATDYGLCASVWSHDDDLVTEVSRRLDAGVVFVNNHGTAAVDHRAPFGGWKQSGVGRELGPDGILAYTRTRSLTRHDLP